jgi:hypothetical protein
MGKNRYSMQKRVGLQENNTPKMAIESSSFISVFAPSEVPKMFYFEALGISPLEACIIG